MGAFIVNFHVRTSDGDSVRKALKDCGAGQSRVRPAENGWVSIYEERASTQDDVWIESLALDLSSRLAAACVAFLVHDSDIASYWLCDQGRLLDQYNSIPDYFDSVSAAERQRLAGQSDVFLRYCRPHVTRLQVESVLRTAVTFAEDTIRQLAEFLGIDPDAALEDFRDDDYGDDGGSWFPDGGFEDEVGDAGVTAGDLIGNGNQARTLRMMQQAAGSFATQFGRATSPQGDALVRAAADGDTAEISRLVEAGADVNHVGLFRIEPLDATDAAKAAGLFPEVPVPPVIAASSKGQAKAVRLLLELGASPHEVHPLLGSALHAAAQRGSDETVRVLLAAGVPADLKNAQGMTPRALLQAVRSQVEMTKNLVRTMPQLQGVYDKFLHKLTEINLPEAGWDACDELLAEANG